MMDYACSAMGPVWDAIEESGLPVTHHIGETPPKAPCEVNNVAVAMMVNIDGFREMFSKYIFGGILDRHPGLRMGCSKVASPGFHRRCRTPTVLASYQHMLDDPLEHDIQYYWDTDMSASFIVDPLGLKLIDQIGVDKVMWSSDYPHNESSFGYSEKSLAAVVEAVGPDAAARIVSGNIKQILGIRDDGFFQRAELRHPRGAHRARMHRDTSSRLRTAMSDQGVDALILLMNDNVVYATGASWPVLDAGLSHVERPVAIVLAGDEHPHLFIPSGKAPRRNPRYPRTICTIRCISN